MNRFKWLNMRTDEEYFIFVDLSNQSTQHNLKFTGEMFSSGYVAASQDAYFKQQYLAGNVNYLPFVVNNNRSTGFQSFYCTSAIANYRVEYDAEVKRLSSFPALPSRLSAVYAFATKEDCREAQRLYNWDLDSVRKFTLIRDHLTKVAKVNMEIVSLMRFAYPRGMWSAEEIDKVWMHYWSGKGNLDIDKSAMQPPPNTHKRVSSGEVWEYLIEGRLKLKGDLTQPISF